MAADFCLKTSAIWRFVGYVIFQVLGALAGTGLLYLILTNTGVFNVRWNKKLASYDEYWEQLDKELNAHGLYTHKVIYGSEFGFMLVTREPADNLVLDRYPAEKKLDTWREYVEQVKSDLTND